MKESLTLTIKSFAKNLGADLIGISSASAFSEAPEGHRPTDLMRNAASVIAMAMRYSDASLENAPSREYSIAYQVVNRELDFIAYRVARRIQDEGFRALQIPASPPYDMINNLGDLSHKHAAWLSGIGVFGKNDLLLTPQFGAKVRLVSVITEAILDTDVPLDIDLCGECDKCIRACPAKALGGNRIVNKKICDDQHVEVGERLQLSDWQQICGVCIRVCPVGGNTV
ncbi:MAG: hypothetical protein K9L30_14025 [Desulfobacterales bacterium]|nr:hypothetical protein [Desulfobacterales bacterium]